MTSSDQFARSPWIVTLVSLTVVVAVLYLATGLRIRLLIHPLRPVTEQPKRSTGGHVVAEDSLA